MRADVYDALADIDMALSLSLPGVRTDLDGYFARIRDATSSLSPEDELHMQQLNAFVSGLGKRQSEYFNYWSRLPLHHKTRRTMRFFCAVVAVRMGLPMITECYLADMSLAKPMRAEYEALRDRVGVRWATLRRDANTLRTNDNHVWRDVGNRQAQRDPFFDRLVKRQSAGALVAATLHDHVALEVYACAPVMNAYLGERQVADAAFSADMERLAPRLCAHLH